MSLIKGMTTVFLTVSSTTGRKKLMREDVKIPSDFNIQELARLGTKTVFNPKALRPFDNCRKNAQAYLTSVGVRYAGGFGIPVSRISEVKEKMALYESVFNNAKTALLTEYQTLLEEWLEDIKSLNPILAETIANNVITKDYLESQIQFSFYSEHDESALVGDKLVEESAQAAKVALDKLVGKGVASKLNRKSLAYLTNIKDKLESMSFLNAAVQPTVDRINGFLNTIPKRDTLGVEWYQALVKEIVFLSDVDNYKLLTNNGVEVDSELDGNINSQGSVLPNIVDSDDATNGTWGLGSSFDDIDPTILATEQPVIPNEVKKDETETDSWF
jgi:hypothetical protein